MDEVPKEATASNEEAGAGPGSIDEKDVQVGVGGTGSAAPPADEPPATTKEEDKPSEKEDATMDDADGEKPTTNGGDGDDGKEKEDDAEPKKEVDKVQDVKDEVPASDAKSPRKKRGAPPKTPPPEAAAPEAASASASGGGREKRARKALVAYAPDDFTKVDRTVQIVPGRGVKVGSIKAVRESVEGCKDQWLVEQAHKLLFGGSKKPSKDAMKANILEFSGYLAPKPDDVTEKELEAIDKKIESKMGEKANHLKVLELRELCDFFALERPSMNTKAELIDRLLDFLSEPSDEFVKGRKSAKTKPSASSKRKGGSSNKKKDDASEGSEEENEEGDDEEEEQEVESKPKKGKKKAVDLLKVEKGEVPSDDTLRAWVGCFVQCYDLEKATTKVALQVAGDKFGVDLADKKELLKEMISEAMG